MEDFGVFNVLLLIGSLGLFIFGMKIMSEGIQKVAGNRLRDILGAMTSNRFTGILTGFFTTSLIQSSSATTVMIVSFVNAGLLTLSQAIGVIMGANIGTTITAVIILVFGFSKFSIASYSLPLIAFGFPMLFFKNSQIKSLGEILIGFSILFMGLDYLKESVPPISPEVLVGLSTWTSYGILSTLLFVLLGTIVTIVLQSSSAAMALTIVLCERGLPFELAAAIVLGENIGTTITANIAAIIGNAHAKRAARAHFIFNVFGVLWMMIVYGWFLDGVNAILESFTDIGRPSADNITATKYALTVFHMLFNVVNVLMLVWFVNLIAKIVIRMVPSKEEDDHFSLEYIGSGIMNTPELSIVEAQKELIKYGSIVKRMLGFLRDLLYAKDKKQLDDLVERVKKYENITDNIEIEVSDYLLKISKGELSDESSLRVRSMLSIVGDLEHMGDIFYQMARTFQRKRKMKAWFTPEQRANLVQMFDLVEESINEMNSNLSNNYESANLEVALELEKKINKMRNSLRKEHLKNMERGDYNFNSGMIYSDLYSSLEKAGDHIVNVNEAIKGEV